jgi:hypothetical protein
VGTLELPANDTSALLEALSDAESELLAAGSSLAFPAALRFRLLTAAHNIKDLIEDVEKSGERTE